MNHTAISARREENLTIYPFHVKSIDPVKDVYLMPEEVTDAEKFYATAKMIQCIIHTETCKDHGQI
ncbi:hypothetical protein ACTXT7_004392 [Hymenolepis weldensis]